MGNPCPTRKFFNPSIILYPSLHQAFRPFIVCLPRPNCPFGSSIYILKETVKPYPIHPKIKSPSPHLTRRLRRTGRSRRRRGDGRWMGAGSSGSIQEQGRQLATRRRTAHGSRRRWTGTSGATPHGRRRRRTSAGAAARQKAVADRNKRRRTGTGGGGWEKVAADERRRHMGTSGYPLGMPVPDGHGHGHWILPDWIFGHGLGTGTWVSGRAWNHSTRAGPDPLPSLNVK